MNQQKLHIAWYAVVDAVDFLFVANTHGSVNKGNYFL
jgi:hypothetical protein